MNKFWTVAEENRLRLLFPDHTYLELARLFDRSLRAVYNKATRLGLTTRVYWRRLLAPHEKLAHQYIMKKGFKTKEAYDLIVKERTKR